MNRTPRKPETHAAGDVVSGASLEWNTAVFV
jgi:hypothetical protein